MPYARCMGKMSRTKGAAGEREVVKLAKLYGLEAERTAALQAGLTGHGDVTLTQHTDYHVEVKRDERLSVDAMLRQAYKDADGKVPVLAYRRNKQSWNAVVPLADFFRLLSSLYAQEMQ